MRIMTYKIAFIIIFSSEGFSGGSQSSIAGYSKLPFSAASQTHLRSGTEGGWETPYENIDYKTNIMQLASAKIIKH